MTKAATRARPPVNLSLSMMALMHDRAQWAFRM
jgi:hypothetical protein